MRRIRTLTGVGRLSTADRDLGAVRYELIVWRDPRGWTVADGELGANGPAIVSAFHSNTQALLHLETGEPVMIEVTQASMATGQFVVSGPMPPRPKGESARRKGTRKSRPAHTTVTGPNVTELAHAEVSKVLPAEAI